MGTAEGPCRRGRQAPRGAARCLAQREVPPSPWQREGPHPSDRGTTPRPDKREDGPRPSAPGVVLEPRSASQTSATRPLGRPRLPHQPPARMSVVPPAPLAATAARRQAPRRTASSRGAERARHAGAPNARTQGEHGRARGHARDAAGGLPRRVAPSVVNGAPRSRGRHASTRGAKRRSRAREEGQTVPAHLRLFGAPRLLRPWMLPRGTTPRFRPHHLLARDPPLPAATLNTHLRLFGAPQLLRPWMLLGTDDPKKCALPLAAPPGGWRGGRPCCWYAPPCCCCCCCCACAAPWCDAGACCCPWPCRPDPRERCEATHDVARATRRTASVASSSPFAAGLAARRLPSP